MKIAYFDCFSGISGDMILSALLDAGLEFDKLNEELKKLRLDNFEIQAVKVVKQNIASTKFNVLYEEEHQHRHLSHLNKIVDQSDFPAGMKQKA
ncbi:MAG: LarC family nickel insertion protein, partial [Calditrichaeota bacterium]|nr:LarC family nickel insertion protein [Calditrichota bacterium]